MAKNANLNSLSNVVPILVPKGNTKELKVTFNLEKYYGNCNFVFSIPLKTQPSFRGLCSGLWDGESCQYFKMFECLEIEMNRSFENNF